MKGKIIEIIAGIIFIGLFIFGFFIAPSLISSFFNPNEIPEINILELEDQIFEEINEERQKNGLNRLRYNSKLYNLAKIKSHDMAINKYFSHRDLKGNLVCDYCGENIFKINIISSIEREHYKVYGLSSVPSENINYNSQEDLVIIIVREWMNSEGHKENILNSDYKESAIGISVDDKDFYYITQEFIL